MMSTKFTTQGWSKAVQQHDYGEDPQRRFTSATAEADGGAGKKKDVGEVLNQVANPSGKDTGGHKVRRAHNQLDKDDFLKLMLTQMKNQDPMNPMQSHEMAAQLAQFTSLEQLFNVNKNLENIGTKQDPLAKFEALNFLGKSIKADSRQIFHTGGDSAVYFPLYTKCCELELPLCMNTGLPGPPIPGEAQNPIHLDRVCVRFPELRLCMIHGADPWWDVAIRLMIKYKNLRLVTSAWAPRHLPASLLHFMRTRGKGRVMFASDSPVLSIRRTVKEASELDLPEDVLDNYLYQNAQDFLFSR